MKLSAIIYYQEIKSKSYILYVFVYSSSREKVSGNIYFFENAIRNSSICCCWKVLQRVEPKRALHKWNCGRSLCATATSLVQSKRRAGSTSIVQGRVPIVFRNLLCVAQHTLLLYTLHICLVLLNFTIILRYTYISKNISTEKTIFFPMAYFQEINISPTDITITRLTLHISQSKSMLQSRYEFRWTCFVIFENHNRFRCFRPIESQHLFWFFLKMIKITQIM